MDSINVKNVSFILLLLLVLGFSFCIVHFVGSFDSSSMYTQLFYGESE